MKKIVLLVIFFLCFFSITEGISQTQPTYYTCPMHPQIHEPKPGDCPICGMTLIKEKAKAVKKNVGKKPVAKKPNVIQQAIPKNDSLTILKTKEIVIPKDKPATIKTIVNSAPPKTVRYDLYVRDTIVTFGNKPKRAIAVNGQIPMPTLTFTEGDTAEIYVHNELKESTSLHWHGLMLPNKEDGVPYLTQMPIYPGTTHKYSFPIIQNGTHWYHSHSGLQEQIGMYGSMILNKREELDIPTIPIILSEWTDMKPNNVHRMLHNGSDWFAIQKGTTQSYAEAIRAGHFKTKIVNEWKRMKAMDVSDIYYEQFLINGKNDSQLSQFKVGDKVRLRISNGGASTYFWLNYAGGKIKVIANDGNDVEPVEVDRLLIAVSETYDVIVTIPAENTSYEFLATSEDRTNSASIYLGNGVKKVADVLPKLKYFEGMKMMNEMMNMNGTMNDMGMDMSFQKMDMNSVMYPEISGKEENKEKNIENREEKIEKSDDMKKDHSGHNKNDIKMPKEQYNSNELSEITTLNYAMLKSPLKTYLPKNAPVRELRFELTGNMNRYVWSMNNKVLSETDKILIKKGENIRITLHNNSMMRHPMHLHGHDFRILNGQGEYAPLKNTIDIMPMETDVIEFEANADGDWFFHCHILYHMMAGMNRVFSYENSQVNPYLPNKDKAYKKLQTESNQMHFMAENDFATNGNDGKAMLQDTRWSFGTEWRLGYHDEHGYESETHIGRYIDKMQWLMPFVGFDWRYRKMGIDKHEQNLFGQANTKDERAVFSIGVNYTLPMLVLFQSELYMDGKIRLQLMREDIPISKRIRMGFMINTDKEYMLDARYIIKKNLSIRTHYDSDMGFGIGVNLNY